MDLKQWDAEAWLAAIVEGAEDAIISKDINGVIVTWNSGAQRLFGFSAEEAIGQHIYLLIPEDRRAEEDDILRQIRAGLRVAPLETVRRRKDGSLVDVLLSISPIRDRNGAVIGASKLARDISERRQLQEKQVLLLHEMNHRVKNLFTLAGTVVSLSARHAQTPQELSSAVQQRLISLSAAHQLTLLSAEAPPSSPGGNTTFAALIRAIVAPYQEDDNARVRVAGTDVEICSRAVTSIALLLHEFTSNSVKYGALATCGGLVDIQLSLVADKVHMSWVETGGPTVEQEPATKGFGARLETLISKTIDGKIARQWRSEGLKLELIVPMRSLMPPG